MLIFDTSFKIPLWITLGLQAIYAGVYIPFNWYIMTYHKPYPSYKIYSFLTWENIWESLAISAGIVALAEIMIVMYWGIQLLVFKVADVDQAVAPTGRAAYSAKKNRFGMDDFDYENSTSLTLIIVK